MPMDINLSLSFFAELLGTEKENLNYTIIKRKNNGMVVRHPALTVSGIDKYAFDLVEGRFVKLGAFRSGTITLEKRVVIVKNEETGSWTFWDRDGHRIEYTPEDVRRVYTYRFINPALYE